MNIIRGEECVIYNYRFSYVVCVFFLQQYTLKRLSPEKKAVLLRSHFLETFCTEGLAGNWFEFAVIMQSRTKYTLCKKSRQKAAHTGLVSVGEHKAERGGRLVPPLFETV